ncbi:hypothetical protein DFH06DRAFT_1118510 [Mycena polygramma]|nr:hypothetical protein DFH06DRAFT_1118510 [Mycena polygramma]
MSKRGRRAFQPAQFFDISAPEGAEEEEEEEDPFVVPDGAGIREEQDIGLLFQRPDEEAEEWANDAEDIARRFSSRSGSSDEALQLWKVEKGHERDVVNTIRRWSESTEAPVFLRGVCPFQSAARGHVYLWGRRYEDIAAIQSRVAFMKNTPAAHVSDLGQSMWLEEPGDLTGTWVRYTGSGKYCGDLAWVLQMRRSSLQRTKATVDIALVPRLSVVPPQRLSSVHVPQMVTEMEKKRKRDAALARPPRSLYLPDQQLDRELKKHQSREAEGSEFWGGLLILRSISTAHISEEGVGASSQEVSLFQASPVYADLFASLLDQKSRRGHITALLKELWTSLHSPTESPPSFLHGSALFTRAVTLFMLGTKHNKAIMRRHSEEEELLTEQHEKNMVRRQLRDLRESRAREALLIDSLTGYDSIPDQLQLHSQENDAMHSQGKEWMYLVNEEWQPRCAKELEILHQDAARQLVRDQLEGEAVDLGLWCLMAGEDSCEGRNGLKLKGWMEQKLPPLRSGECNVALSSFQESWKKLLQEGARYMEGRDTLLEALEVHGQETLYDALMSPEQTEAQKPTLLNLFKLPPQKEAVQPGDEVRVLDGPWKGYVGLVQQIDHPRVIIQVKQNGESATQDFVMEMSSICLNFVLSDRVQVVRGWRTGERGYIVDLDWDKLTGEIFRRVPPLEHPHGYLVTVPQENLWAPELVTVNLSTLKRCQDTQLPRVVHFAAQDPGLQTSEQRDALEKSQNLENMRKRHAKYVGLQVEVVRGKEDEDHRYVRMHHPDELMHFRGSTHPNLPMHSTQPPEGRGTLRPLVDVPKVSPEERIEGVHVVRGKLGDKEWEVDIQTQRPQTERESREKDPPVVCLARELQLKGTRGTVQGIHYHPDTGWWFDLMTEGRAVNSVVQVRERHLVERFTRQQLHIYINMDKRTRAVLEERVRKDKQKNWEEADQELEFDKRWPSLAGHMTRQEKRAMTSNHPSMDGSKTPPPVSGIPDTEPETGWYVDHRDRNPPPILPEEEDRLHEPRPTRPPVQSTPSNVVRPFRDGGEWLNDRRLLNCRIDFKVLGSKQDDYRKGAYEGRIGFLVMKELPARKKFQTVDTIIGQHHAFLNLRIKYLQPMITTEREGAPGPFHHIFTVPGTQVVIIGADVTGSTAYIGHVGEVVSGDTEIGKIRMGSMVLSFGSDVTIMSASDSARKRASARDRVLDALKTIKEDSLVGLAGDSPGSLEFRTKLRDDAKQLTKMAKQARQPRNPPAVSKDKDASKAGQAEPSDQNNGKNVASAQKRIGSLFKRAEEPPVSMEEYIDFLTSGDETKPLQKEDVAFAMILRGYDGDQGKEAWTAALQPLFMTSDSSNVQLMRSLEEAEAEIEDDDLARLILVQEKFIRDQETISKTEGWSFRMVQTITALRFANTWKHMEKSAKTDFYKDAFLALPDISADLGDENREDGFARMKGKYEKWMGRMKFVVAARAKLLQAYDKIHGCLTAAQFGPMIFLDPFWTVPNLHQHKRSAEFGIMFKLLMEQLPVDDGLTINLKRYETSVEAAYGILEAVDAGMSKEVKKLLQVQLDEYGKLCQELEAEGF